MSMNLLFIDIECANCKDGAKLCEFGYVLTDEKFNVKLRENILINPKSSFDPYVIKNMLNFSKADYEKSPIFSQVYQKIYSLLTEKDTLVVGHTIAGDAVHIGDDCVRYSLPTPDFSYVDVVELFKSFDGSKNATSLVKMCTALEIETGEKVHSADVDAHLTMLVSKKLTEKAECDFLDLVKDNPQSKGSIKDYAKKVQAKRNYDKFVEECNSDGIKLTTGAQSSVIRLFKKYVLIKGKADLDKLNGKAVCLSGNLELTEYNKTLNLIQLIKNYGGINVSQPTKCDIFVKWDLFAKDGENVFCKKLDAVQTLQEKGEKIEVYSLSEFLNLVGCEEGQLDKPNAKAIEKFIKQKTKHAYSDDTSPTTIGEILKNKIKE